MGTVEALLCAPEKWTQGALARDCDGNEVEAMGQIATCYCLSGALWVVAADDESKFHELLNKFCDANGLARGSRHMIEWNDAEGRTYEEVITAVRKAGI